jgi:ethanolamine ammonia-lyase small subunit
MSSVENHTIVWEQVRDFLGTQRTKEVARATRYSVAAVEKWRAGGRLSADALLRLAARYAEIREVVYRAVGADHDSLLTRLERVDAETAELKKMLREAANS